MIKMQEKDFLNLVLVFNFKCFFFDLNDDDVKVEVWGGVVYVFIFDQFLFQFGSFWIIVEVNEVFGKVVMVVSDYSDFNLMVEGYIDNVFIFNNCIKDNWDLSVKCVMVVVRVLEEEYYVDFICMIVVGWADKLFKVDNDFEIGCSFNCCIEIVIMLCLDQFFQLLEFLVVVN